MRKAFCFVALLAGLLLAVSPVSAFNSGTHIYIAEKVYKKLWVPVTIDLQYGSIAPDLVMFVTNPAKWDPETAFDQTHYGFIDLRPYAWTFSQRAFARGWITHNEDWGADRYAHIACNGGGGYVTDKVGMLISGGYVPPEYSDFAHFAVETAIDLLLQEHRDRFLGEKLLLANLLRNREDQNLLIRVFVWREKKTDLLTLVSTELNFRVLAHEYARALALSTLTNKEPLVELGVEMAERLYGLTVPAEDVRNLLNAAIGMCGDYNDVVTAAINGIYNELK
jgi:hypothetical protein